MKRKERHGAIFCVILTGIAVLTASCTPTPLPPVNTDSQGLAIKGYDPVAYFTEGKPVQGLEEYQYEFEGTYWRFSSKEHMELFMKNPDMYAPQYGGYCAYAVSRGTTADIDPEAWTIVDGKLYLNLNLDIQEAWRKDIPGNIEKGDRYWPGVLEK